ncbi:MAG: hypothetical protein GY805_34930 [Chloroflexi bacterium]|nr:hypothetical protein [Chloroflexota bacterium]
MENMTRDIHKAEYNEADISHIAYSPSIYLIVVIFISILVSAIAIFAGGLPWFEWFVPGPLWGDKIDYTNIYQMLPKFRSGVISTVGAMRNDGNLVLTIGWISRFFIAFILIISTWLIIKSTDGKWSLILLFLLPFACFFMCQLFWVGWADNEVWIANHEMMPRLTRIDWKGPILIAICFLIQVGLVITAKILGKTVYKMNLPDKA